MSLSKCMSKKYEMPSLNMKTIIPHGILEQWPIPAVQACKSQNMGVDPVGAYMLLYTGRSRAFAISERTRLHACLRSFRCNLEHSSHLSKLHVQRLKGDATGSDMGGRMVQGRCRPSQHDKRLLQILIGTCSSRNLFLFCTYFTLFMV